MMSSTTPVNNKHKIQCGELKLPVVHLFGPGPSNLHPRVNLHLSANMVGYTDQSYYKVMDETMELMRYLFQTDNHFTIPISGAGTAAMETCVANLIEPQDKVVCCVAGYFSDRIYQMAIRYGTNITKLEKKWGQWFDLQEIEEALAKHQPSLLTMVFGETSTGIKQAMDGIGQLCRKYNCLLMVDTVAALGGVPFFVDEWGVDACYTGGQKALSGPPGISPLTFSNRAMQKIKARKVPVANWYLDATLLEAYWCPSDPATPRKYHHTTPANLIYALREALMIIAEEGLENVWNRHRASAHELYQGLQSIGLTPMIDTLDDNDAKGGRLYTLTTVLVPQGVDAKQIMQLLLTRYNIEIVGGIGELAGKIWRIGLMGFNSTSANVKLLIQALKDCLEKSKQ